VCGGAPGLAAMRRTNTMASITIKPASATASGLSHHDHVERGARLFNSSATARRSWVSRARVRPGIRRFGRALQR
jgi:hypothetical protein